MISELYASIAPAAGHAAESWPTLLGAFLGSALAHRANRRQMRRMVRGLNLRLHRIESFLGAHFKLPPLRRDP